MSSTTGSTRPPWLSRSAARRCSRMAAARRSAGARARRAPSPPTAASSCVFRAGRGWPSTTSTRPKRNRRRRHRRSSSAATGRCCARCRRLLGTGVPAHRRQLRPRRLPHRRSRRGRPGDRRLPASSRGDYERHRAADARGRAGGDRRAAVNDVVATSSTLGRMVELDWSVGGEPLGRQPCDGIICATPSGSTAYNLSNGGPVLVWGLDAMAVTFIAPAFAARAPAGRPARARRRGQERDAGRRRDRRWRTATVSRGRARRDAYSSASASSGACSRRCRR